MLRKIAQRAIGIYETRYIQLDCVYHTVVGHATLYVVERLPWLQPAPAAYDEIKPFGIVGSEDFTTGNFQNDLFVELIDANNWSQTSFAGTEASPLLGLLFYAGEIKTSAEIKVFPAHITKGMWNFLSSAMI